MNRRSLIGLGATALAGLSLRAATAEATRPSGDAEEIVTLWPGTPPGGDGVSLRRDTEERSFWPGPSHDRVVRSIQQPTLSVFRPDRPDGSALLIVPGGGYRHLMIDKEGSEVARWFNGSGITAFVLCHRLPAEGWANRADVPLQDAQRATRLIRARAAQFGIDPARVGVLGFSAGGHVAASLMTRFDAHLYEPVDESDRERARPDFAGLIYPVISMVPPLAHAGSREELLGADPSSALEAAYSCDRLVTTRTSPGFILAAADDTEVDPQNSLVMFSALRAAGVPSELHMFEEGGHGFSLRRIEGRPLAAWSDLFLRWGALHQAFRSVPL